MLKISILIIITGALVCGVIADKEFFASNYILKGLVNHEILALLSVIMTVTFASVANIYVSLNKIAATKFKNSQRFKDAAREVKVELRDNCGYLFIGFIAAFALIIFRGWLPENFLASEINATAKIVVATVNASIIWIFCLYMLCMYDVYQVVFAIADMELASGTNAADDED